MTGTWLLLALGGPLVAAAAAIPFMSRHRVQVAAGLAGAVVQTLAAVMLLRQVNTHGTLVLQAGDWPAPFGISLVADQFAALVLLAGAVAGLASLAFAAMHVEAERSGHGYFVFTNVLLAAVAAAFLTGDLFNLYVAFEVMLIASFVLLSVGHAPRQARGAAVYVTLNLIASATFLVGAGLAYALAGTLNFADLSERLALVENRALVLALALLLLGAFITKSAAFPFAAWLPASYHTPGTDVSALFSGLLTKVGVYAVARTVTLLFPGDEAVRTAVLVIAGLTMVVGVLGALAQYELRRLLSFHISSQVGYMLMGIGLTTPLALAGATFYMMQHMITKTALFLVAGFIERGAGTGQLRRLGGLYRQDAPTAAVFLVAAFALAGIPPFAGFIAKFTLARAGVESEAWLLVGVSLAVSLLTLLSMVKIWTEAFWKVAPEGETWQQPARRFLLPGAALALVSAGMGIVGAPLVEMAVEAGAAIASPAAYVEAVLGSRAP
ncbi:MAG: cation:proton antiporter [Chloroflexota bacterium]